MSTSLLDYYQACRLAGDIRPDPAQERVARALHELAADLPRLVRRPLWPWGRLGGWRGGRRGLYIYGTVGRGKTMLMDMFFASVQGVAKRRVHFHAFMAEVHARLHALRGQGRVEALLPALAAAIAKESRLLCFDEFQVHNIADAMILARLFRGLFAEGVVVVATSNTAPDELYSGGLQRTLFLPFIELLRKRLDVLRIDDGQDYRQERLKGLPVYLVPHDNDAYTALQQIFNRLTDTAHPEPLLLDLGGRKLPVPRAARGVAWFSFAELCQQPLAAADYIRLMDFFHTIILEDVPSFTEERRDEVLRFIHLVDVAYDHKAKLVVSAARAARDLLPISSPLWAQYGRTVSRLEEMQSQDYLQTPHAIVKGTTP